MSKISDLVAFAKTDITNEQREVVLGNVANFQAQEINKITGVKINGAKRIITSSGIRHAIKEHGNNKEQLESHPDFELTHVHLNDGTVAGMRMKSKNCFSVQYHPEASPGPHDSSYLFDEFIKNIETSKN